MKFKISQEVIGFNRYPGIEKEITTFNSGKFLSEGVDYYTIETDKGIQYFDNCCDKSDFYNKILEPVIDYLE